MVLILGQFFKACQYIAEERFTKKSYIDAVEAVGWEGIWGTFFAAILIVPLSHLKLGANYGSFNPSHTMEDVVDGFKQLINDAGLLISFVVYLATVGCYRLTGMAVTKYLSATTRAVLENCRHIPYWAIALAAGWEKFVGLNVVGSITLLIGVLWYFAIGLPQFLRPFKGPGFTGDNDFLDEDGGEEETITVDDEPLMY